MLHVRRIAGKSEIVVEQIEGWIRSGDVEPKEKLPSVRELCDMFKVGRSAVRDALTTLKGKGLVDVRHGEGTFVCHMDTTNLLPDVLLQKGDITKLYQVRKILEVGIVEMAAVNASSGQLDTMKHELDELSKAEAVKGWEADYQFHQAIAAACSNDILIDLMEAVSATIKKGMIDCHRIILSDKRLSSDVAAQHAAIYDAIRATDKAKAREAMLYHLTYVEDLLNSHLQNSNEVRDEGPVPPSRNGGD
ncbi:GntR family transcriptional regulator [Virgibacillus phasianinus]|uniref:GntR family transcriptional regulator n=1 Tax=Virgibacillus phasianinus TaxID=2017483 RepID=A0A220U3R3_9BACI|nr:FadR/GntR family transcriptional regulator [Virgibacillus phasianinus]ASK62461.1 GntR family transcriptional regulator [Virgibacillus phasianinus]